MTTKHGVGKAYLDQLAYQLRMRGVSQDKIGDILAEVETHVATTGEPARAAFGTPREYARVWAPRPQPSSWTAFVVTWYRSVAGLIGVVWTCTGVWMYTGFPSVLEPGRGAGWYLAGGLALLATWVGAAAHRSAALGRGRTRAVLRAVLTAAAMVLALVGFGPLVVGAFMLGRGDPTYGLDRWWVAGVGGALVLAAAAIAPVDIITITDPRSGRPFFSDRRRLILMALAAAAAFATLFTVVGLLTR